MLRLLLVFLLLATPAYAAAPTFDGSLYSAGKTPTLAKLAAEFKSIADALGRPGQGALTDVDATVVWGTSKNTQVLNVPITANRALTLSTTGAIEGARFRVVRTAAATGSFNLNVGTGPLKAMGSAGTWAEFAYSGSAWLEVAAGSL